MRELNSTVSPISLLSENNSTLPNQGVSSEVVSSNATTDPSPQQMTADVCDLLNSQQSDAPTKLDSLPSIIPESSSHDMGDETVRGLESSAILVSPSLPIGVMVSSSVDQGVEELASIGAAMSPSITRDFDVGIPIDYVPSPEPKAFYSKMQRSIIENFREAVVPELSTKHLLELVQSTTRILISLSLPLENWRNYTLSLLRIWDHRDQTIPTRHVDPYHPLILMLTAHR